MINLCGVCNKPLSDGDEISFLATGTYHFIPSIKSWALGRESLEADVDSLCHKACDSEEDD